MPGSIFTPVLRVDLVHEDVVSEKSGTDAFTELVTLTVRFFDTRAKDVAAIAIARERSNGLGAAGGGGSANAALSPNNSDALGARLGDDENVGGFAIYTPDEDPIIAYVPMADLLNDPNHPLDPYDTEFFVTFNLVEPGSGRPIRPAFAWKPEDADQLPLSLDTYNLITDIGKSSLTPPNGILSAFQDAFRANTATFYVLVEPSTSLENNAQIGCTLPAFNVEGNPFQPAAFFCLDPPMLNGCVQEGVGLPEPFTVPLFDEGGDVTIPVGETIPEAYQRDCSDGVFFGLYGANTDIRPDSPNYGELTSIPWLVFRNPNPALTCTTIDAVTTCVTCQETGDGVLNDLNPGPDFCVPEDEIPICTPCEPCVVDPDPGPLTFTDVSTCTKTVTCQDQTDDQGTVIGQICSYTLDCTRCSQCNACDVCGIDASYFPDPFTTVPDGPGFQNRPRFLCVDMAADQVPLRKIDNFDIRITGGAEITIPNDAFQRSSRFRDNRVWSEFPNQALPDDNRIWSQWPPGYPPLSLASRSPNNASDYVIAPGRVHPDSGIVSGPLPSPEVIGSALDYSWFGFDMAAGWPGGYAARIGEMKIEVQGLGAIRELPGDGKDNDGDGLTDETGAEDTPRDLQLPGRNDDFDFFTEIINPLTVRRSISAVTQALDGSPLTAAEMVLAASISQLYASGEELGEKVPGLEGFFLPGQAQPPDIRVKRGIERGVYNKGWDPVFSVTHILDEHNLGKRFDEKLAKYYRDIVTPGYDPERASKGLTDAFQPQLAIQLDKLEAPRRDYVIQLFRIGALQSRLIDEDGDGEDSSPTQFGYKIGDRVDNDTNQLVDEGIDEEAEDSFDDDLDGLVDEDINFVPAFMAIDEEVNNFFIDGLGGISGSPERGKDFIYLDYNNDGVYDDGRNDHITPNRDELISSPPGGSNLLAQGQSYFLNGLVFPIDDDLDAEGEDGNPLTAAPSTFDLVDNDNDGLIDEGWNEDCRDVVFGELGNQNEFGVSRLPYGYVSTSFLYEDTNGNTRFEARSVDPNGVIGDTRIDQPVTPFRDGDTFLPPVRISLLADDLMGIDPDRYLISYEFGDRDRPGIVFPGVPGPELPNYFDAKYDFFVGFQIPPNMPPGLDFQVSMCPGDLKFANDFRTNDIPNEGQPEGRDDAQLFSLPEFTYPHVISPEEAATLGQSRVFDVIDSRLAERYPAMAQIRNVTITGPARSTAYQVTKRQFAHLEIADVMGFTSPLEKDGGFRGRPYLEADSAPTAIFGINIVDTPVGISENQTRISSVRVNFVNADIEGNGFFDPRVDLKPLSNDRFTDPDTGQQFSDSGVALYRDNKVAGIRGEFDPSDEPVTLALDSLEWHQLPSADNGFYVVLRPAAQSLGIPDTDFDEIPGSDLSQFDSNRGYDYFIVVRTSDRIDARDSFRAFIRAGDIRLTNGFNVTGSECITHPFTANVPIKLEREIAKTRDIQDEPGATQITLPPGSNSVPILGINLHDANSTFDGSSPARLATVSVLLEPAEARSVVLYPRSLPAAVGATGELSFFPGPCDAGELRCILTSDATKTIRHEITLETFVSANTYEADLWLVPSATVFVRIFHTNLDGVRRLVATNAPRGEDVRAVPYGPNVAPEEKQILLTPQGVQPMAAVPGEKITLEVEFVPALPDGVDPIPGIPLQACYLFNDCPEGEGASHILLYNTVESPFNPQKVATSPIQRLARLAEKGALAKDPVKLQKQAGFSTNFLADLTGDILTNIPLDPAEDNDGDPRTFPLPDGLDNDGDGLTDEGVDNTMTFSPLRYTTLSGVAIFRDMPNSDTNGDFDDPLDPDVVNPDLPVFLSGEESFDFPTGTSALVVLALDHDPVANVGPGSPGKGDPVDLDPFETIPADDELLNAGDDYFIVIRTSRFFSVGNTFQVRLGVLFGSVNPAFPGDNLAVFAVPFGFMRGYTTGLGPVFPFRQPFLFDPLRNFRGIPSQAPVAEEPLSPGSVYIPNADNPEDRFVRIETPFQLYESYKSLASYPVIGGRAANSPPSLRWLEPTFDQVSDVQVSLSTGTILLKWNDLDQDDNGGQPSTVTLVYYPVLVDPVLGEIIPRTPNDLKPDGTPFDFKVISGIDRRLNPGESIAGLSTFPYENQRLSTDNEEVDPRTGRGNDVFTWDARLVTPGLYRVAAILQDGVVPGGTQPVQILVVGGKVKIENERPSVTITQP